MQFLKDYSTVMATAWLVSWALSVVHSFFNDRELTIGGLVGILFFGPLNTRIRYADWNTVVIRWPQRKKE